MTSNTELRSESAVTGPGPVDDPDAFPEPTLPEVLHRIFAFFYNKNTGLILILVLGAMSLLGILFQQAPADVRADPQAWAAWLDAVRPRYRGWTDPLAFMGIFGVFDSWWFRGAAGLLSLSILACTLHRAPLLWRQATLPHTHVTEAFFEHARLHGQRVTTAAPAAAVDGIAHELRRRGFRIIADERGPGLNLYADRFRWAPFGTVVAHVAFVLIMAGVLISGAGGFTEDQFVVTVGTRADVGHGTGLAVEARSFTDTYTPQGRPSDYASELVLFKDGREVAAQTVRVNSPLRYDGISFNQSFHGIAAVLLVADQAGGVVFAGGVPLQWQTDDGERVYGKVTVNERNLEIYVVAPSSGTIDAEIGAGQLRVEVYPADSTAAIGGLVLTQGTSAAIDGLAYTFQREQKYTGLIVSGDPGAPWVWAGSLLLVIGTCTTMFFRHRRLWLRVTPQADGALVRLASSDRHELTFTTQFNAILDSQPGAVDAERTTTHA